MSVVKVTREEKVVKVTQQVQRVVKAVAVGPQGPAGPSGASTFIDLTDTPGAYGVAGNVLAVNQAGDGVAEISTIRQGATNLVLLPDGTGQVLTEGAPSPTEPLVAFVGDADSGITMTDQSGLKCLGFTLDGTVLVHASDTGTGPNVFFAGGSLFATSVTTRYAFRLATGNVGFDIQAGVGYNLYHVDAQPITINSMDASPKLRFRADALGGSVTLVGPDIVGDISFTLPAVDGTNRQVLSTNGAGVLSFITLLASDLSDVPNRGTARQILRVNSGGTAHEYISPGRTVGVTIDNGSTVIPVGVVSDVQVFRTGAIQSLTLVSNTNTTITVTVERATFANYPTFSVLGTITLSATNKIQNNSFSGTINDRDIVRFRVSEAASNVATRISAFLEVE